jgi:hypothetical protein
MDTQYSILSPLADRDPVPLRGLSPRLTDLNGKKIGLFTMAYKHASARINSVIEKRLKEKFPTATFTYYERKYSGDFDNFNDHLALGTDTEATLAEFEEWVRGVDAVVGAVGD